MSTFTVQAFDVKAFRSFCCLFDKNNQFNSKLYTSIKLCIEVNRSFITAPTQEIVYIKFFESIRICSQFRYKNVRPEDRQKMSMLQNRHLKLKNLILNNSILKQHFGLTLEHARLSACSWIHVGTNMRYCTVHHNNSSVNIPIDMKISPPVYVSNGDDMINSEYSTYDKVIEDVLEDRKTVESESFLDKISLGLQFWNRF